MVLFFLYLLVKELVENNKRNRTLVFNDEEETKRQPNSLHANTQRTEYEPIQPYYTQAQKKDYNTEISKLKQIANWEKSNKTKEPPKKTNRLQPLNHNTQGSLPSLGASGLTQREIPYPVKNQKLL